MKLLDSIDIASTTMEYIMALGILVAISAVLSFLGSRIWLGRAIIASYIALVFAQFIPQKWMNFSDYSAIIIFCAIVLFLVIVSVQFIYAMDEWEGSWWSWQFLLFSVVSLGMLMSIFAQLLPSESLRILISSDSVRTVFIAPTAQLIWLLLPIAVATIWHRR